MVAYTSVLEPDCRDKTAFTVGLMDKVRGLFRNILDHQP